MFLVIALLAAVLNTLLLDDLVGTAIAYGVAGGLASVLLDKDSSAFEVASSFVCGSLSPRTPIDHQDTFQLIDMVSPVKVGKRTRRITRVTQAMAACSWVGEISRLLTRPLS